MNNHRSSNRSSSSNPSDRDRDRVTQAPDESVMPGPISAATLADDPRLTQYALGDIEDGAMTAEEIAVIEQALRDHPELQAQVASIRETAGALAAELQSEPPVAAGLSAAQRSGVLAALAPAIDAAGAAGAATNSEPSDPPAPIAMNRWISNHRMWVSAAAAMVVIGGGLVLAIPFFADVARPNAKMAVEDQPDDTFATNEVLGRGGGDAAATGLDAAGLEVRERAASGKAALTEGLLADRVTAGRETQLGQTIYRMEAPSSPPPTSAAPLPSPSMRGALMRAESATRRQPSTGARDGGLAAEGRTSLGAPLATTADTIAESAEAFDLDAEVGQHTRLDFVNSAESYAAVTHNDYQTAAVDPISTFSIDVDTAAYANTRRFLNEGQLPPPGAVRVEEFINAFDWNYAPPSAEPKGNEPPFATHVEIGPAPWKPEHRLVKVGLKGYEVPADNRPPVNLVFLVDVSGSMSDYNKLPLVQQSMRMLVETLGADDRIAIVTYANGSQVLLASTSSFQKEKILAAIDSLSAGGSTHASAGIHDAYKIAQENFIEGGANRIILATDGDFNVGTTNTDELVKLMQEKAKSNVFVTVLGFGTGNYKDDRLEQIANKGNGNYAYIDSEIEAEKVLVHGLAGSLIAIAKDVKIQVVFNPQHVAGYRLIGYENRMLETEDFIDDRKDAGEIGVGHEVTALYEVVPAGLPVPEVKAPEKKPSAAAEETPTDQGASEETPEASARAESGADDAASEPPFEKPALDETEAEAIDQLGADDLMIIKLRWKHPEGDTSTEHRFTTPVSAVKSDLAATSDDFRFAAAVSMFGQVLRGSPYLEGATLDQVIALAEGSKAKVPASSPRAMEQSEFVLLVHWAMRLSGNAQERSDD